jgi:murein DD-endopeptidase MepM/ murein hydrolase activator NlpD
MPEMERNKTKMSLPFSGEWYTTWGGENPDQNQHAASETQRYAMDFVMVDEKGKPNKNNGDANEDYYAFGQNIIAPCDATVVEAIDGVRDNNPGEMNTMHTGGNMVMLKTPENEYIVLAHLKNGTVKVKAGEQVKKGEVLGQCGNSGNSSEPHLHFHIQNMSTHTFATAVRCYFDKLKVTSGKAKPVNKENYMPVREDKVRNL